jgi:plasmid stabilization system protein ParE
MNLLNEHRNQPRLQKKIRNEILVGSRKITYTEQYQVDEILGQPTRRMIIRHYKIIYKVHSETEIRVLNVFDTRQNRGKIKRNK